MENKPHAILAKGMIETRDLMNLLDEFYSKYVIEDNSREEFKRLCDFILDFDGPCFNEQILQCILQYYDKMKEVDKIQELAKVALERKKIDNKLTIDVLKNVMRKNGIDEINVDDIKVYDIPKELLVINVSCNENVTNDVKSYEKPLLDLQTLSSSSIEKYFKELSKHNQKEEFWREFESLSKHFAIFSPKTVEEILNFAVRHNDFQRAYKIFEQCYQFKSIFTKKMFEVKLETLKRLGKFDMLFKLFNRYRSNKKYLSVEMFESVISGCLQYKRTLNAFDEFMFMKKLSFKTSNKILEVLLNELLTTNSTLVKTKDDYYFLMIVNEIETNLKFNEKPSALLMDYIIRKFGANGKINECVAWFNRLNDLKIPIEKSHIKALIWSFSRNGAIQNSNEILSLNKDLPLDILGELYEEHLLALLANKDSLNDSIVFSAMKEKGMPFSQTFFSSHNVDQSHVWLERAIKENAYLETKSYVTFIKLLFSAGNPDKAEEVYNLALTRLDNVKTSLFNVMMEYYLNFKDFDKIDKVLDDMKRLHVEWNAYTISFLMRKYILLKDLDNALKYSDFKRLGYFGSYFQLGVFLMQLVDLCIELNRPSLAFPIIQNLCSDGYKVYLQTYIRLLDNCSTNKDSETGMKIIKAILDKGSPDSDFCEHALAFLNEVDNLEAAKELISIMKNDEIQLTSSGAKSFAELLEKNNLDATIYKSYSYYNSKQIKY
ncbi:hypothetical protein O9G_000909 [Rozella allomycis CSF55]|uniref:Pentacotripeptide-repeat region of PRORP domain-containing protein n=1 Tax=Rozella allomycis (strain CSF55) TaxID=988480 RepID=A0A075ANB3_ROZAC|nr:hypothetical protein O9G_000909 [Rozella allomycis CSF55]|eukprot:EPZ31264.1 hypothetical protein O9G_000909 [Rozella allomycis CSF55]